MTREQKDYILANYKEMTTTDIARHLGLWPSSVCYILRRAGVPKKKTEALPRDIRDKIIALYPDHTTREISRMLGVPLKRVRNVGNHCEIKKTSETIKRAIMEGALGSKEKKSLARKALYQSERRRLIMGLPQKTGLKVSYDRETSNKLVRLSIRQASRGYIRLGLLALGYTDKQYRPGRNKYNLTYIDMRSKAPILTFRGRDADGEIYEGQLLRMGMKLFINYTEDGEIYTSDEIIPESVEHVRTEYITIKNALQ